jgi:HD superfamily phosphohydrolase YqeK
MKNLILVFFLFIGVDSTLQGQTNQQTESLINEMKQLEEVLFIADFIEEKIFFVDADGQVVKSVLKSKIEDKTASIEVILLFQKSNFMFENLGNAYYLIDTINKIKTEPLPF